MRRTRCSKQDQLLFLAWCAAVLCRSPVVGSERASGCQERCRAAWKFAAAIKLSGRPILARTLPCLATRPRKTDRARSDICLHSQQGPSSKGTQLEQQCTRRYMHWQSAAI